MKKILLACTALLLFAACKKEPDYAAGYIGTWDNGPVQVQFNEDKTYSLTNPDMLYTGNGTYEVNKTDITLKDNAAGCPDSVIGTYIYRDFIDSDQGTFTEYLTLSLSFDTCYTRAAILPGTYTLHK